MLAVDFFHDCAVTLRRLYIFFALLEARAANRPQAQNARR
jgi:hypothetical protein